MGLSVVTAVGRWEPEYLRDVGLSLTETGLLVDWVLSIDNPAVRVEDIESIVSEFPVRSRVITHGRGQLLGAGAARNCALPFASEEYVMIVDSDDMVVPEFLPEMLRVAREGQLAWVAGRCVDIGPDGEHVWDGPPDVFREGIIPAGRYLVETIIRNGVPFCNNATILRTELVRAINGWPAGFVGRAEDTAMLAVLTSQHDGWWFPHPVMKYRKHSFSVTAGEEWVDRDRGFDAMVRFIAQGTTNR